nr:hypothetical protein [Jiangella gansuensis]
MHVDAEEPSRLVAIEQVGTDQRQQAQIGIDDGNPVGAAHAGVGRKEGAGELAQCHRPLSMLEQCQRERMIGDDLAQCARFADPPDLARRQLGLVSVSAFDDQCDQRIDGGDWIRPGLPDRRRGRCRIDEVSWTVGDSVSRFGAGGCVGPASLLLPLVDRDPVLGDDRVRIHGPAEHGGGELAHRLRARRVSCATCVARRRSERGRRSDRSDVTERRSVAGDPQRRAEAPQQHGDIGTLGAVIRMELVQDEICQRLGRTIPQRHVVGPEQQLVEHLVVGQQNVRRLVPHDRAVGDESVLADFRARAAHARVKAGGQAAETRVLGQKCGYPAGLVIGQRIHRIQDERFDAALTGATGAQGMVDNRVEERLGLTGTGAGGHQRRQWRGILAGQPLECPRLVTVRRPLGRVPVQRDRPGAVGGPERQP